MWLRYMPAFESCYTACHATPANVPPAAGLTTTKKAKLRIIAPPGDDERAPVVEFSVPNTRRKYTAGQWVFICIPKLGLLHWHPFTISSASLDADLTLHFICEGKWTREVAALARDNTEMKVRPPAPRAAHARVAE